LLASKPTNIVHRRQPRIGSFPASCVGAASGALLRRRAEVDEEAMHGPRLTAFAART